MAGCICVGRGRFKLHHAALAHHRHCQMGELHDVAARSDRSLRRHHGDESRIEELYDELDCGQPDTREPFRQRVGAQDHHGGTEMGNSVIDAV